MTYNVLMGTLNHTHSLTHSLTFLLARPSSPVGCRRWGCTDERLLLFPVFKTFRCLANITSSFLYALFVFFPIHLFFGLPCVVVPVTSGPLLLITCTCWWQVYRTNRVKRWWLGTWRATRTICTSVSPATEFHRRPCVRSASQSNVSILYTMHHLIFPISQSVQSINQSINQSIYLLKLERVNVQRNKTSRTARTMI